jgi:hypothetical protein
VGGGLRDRQAQGEMTGNGYHASQGPVPPRWGSGREGMTAEQAAGQAGQIMDKAMGTLGQDLVNAQERIRDRQQQRQQKRRRLLALKNMPRNSRNMSGRTTCSRSN